MVEFYILLWDIHHQVAANFLWSQLSFQSQVHIYQLTEV